MEVVAPTHEVNASSTSVRNVRPRRLSATACCRADEWHVTSTSQECRPSSSTRYRLLVDPMIHRPQERPHGRGFLERSFLCCSGHGGRRSVTPRRYVPYRRQRLLPSNEGRCNSRRAAIRQRRTCNFLQRMNVRPVSCCSPSDSARERFGSSPLDRVGEFRQRRPDTDHPCPARSRYWHRHTPWMICGVNRLHASVLASISSS